MSEPNASAIPTSRAASRSRTHKLTVTAMLSAVAFLLMFIEFPIPALIPAFVKLDVSDLPELLAAFSLGPGLRCGGGPAEKPAVSGAPRHLLRLCGRGVQLHHGRRLRLLRRFYLPAQQVPQGRSDGRRRSAPC